MDSSLLITWIGAVASFGTVIGAIVWSNRKISAEGTGVITASAIQMIEKLQEQVTKLEAHLERQDAEMRALKKGVAILSIQLRELGATPKFEFNPFDDD